MNMIIIRGLPGSGKTTLGQCLSYCGMGKLFEADHYFYVGPIYKYVASLLGYAHEDCRRRTQRHLARGGSVIIANTFTTRAEMQPYLDLAKQYQARLQVIECHASFGSVHGVPQETIDAMRARWEVYDGR